MKPLTAIALAAAMLAAPACAQQPPGAAAAAVVPVAPVVAADGLLMAKMAIATAKSISAASRAGKKALPNAPGKCMQEREIFDAETFFAFNDRLDQHQRNCFYIGVSRRQPNLIENCQVPDNRQAAAEGYIATLMLIEQIAPNTYSPFPGYWP